MGDAALRPAQHLEQSDASLNPYQKYTHKPTHTHTHIHTHAQILALALTIFILIRILTHTLTPPPLGPWPGARARAPRRRRLALPTARASRRIRGPPRERARRAQGGQGRCHELGVAPGRGRAARPAHAAGAVPAAPTRRGPRLGSWNLSFLRADQ
ncbi:hypothetical protein T492DRAFT_386245 [Pavlovales sp. CCMP2436]|nr:hypothetical protein T492DRAFT_386245 [Pavlovales sp. CCMP2436]